MAYWFFGVERQNIGASYAIFLSVKYNLTQLTEVCTQQAVLLRNLWNFYTRQYSIIYLRKLPKWWNITLCGLRYFGQNNVNHNLISKLIAMDSKVFANGCFYFTARTLTLLLLPTLRIQTMLRDYSAGQGDIFSRPKKIKSLQKEAR